MLILLFVIFIVGFVLATIFIDDEVTRFVAQMFSGISISVVFIALICVTVMLVNTFSADEMIEMYTEENKNIESQIEIVIDEYMEFENQTFVELKSESFITLVSLYPELKSDELVKEQISLYQNNNAKLKELKSEKINARVYKWWIYFGK